MPELPEVETVRRGLEPYIKNQMIKELVIRQPKLRWPIPPELPFIIKKQVITTIDRRGKYLLIGMEKGTLIIHLGMSGCLKLVDPNQMVLTHDHADIVLYNNFIIRYQDPRRFGAILWTEEAPFQHKLLQHLGPEPLSNCLTSNHLFQLAQTRTQSIKAFLMDGHVVAGIGNIYAQEILFLSKISPTRQANKISKKRFDVIVENIRLVLLEAIAKGGTTLKDFRNSEGKPGYFSQKLKVYGRGGESCYDCGETLKSIQLQQRTTTYCSKCQR